MDILIIIASLYILLMSVMDVNMEKMVNSFPKEYCMFSTFQPSCEQLEVIVMQHAVYGRMRVGKCLSRDFFLGCSVDVLEIVDGVCSGRNSCSMFVPIADIRDSLRCIDDGLTAYLEASYTCQKVHMPRNQQCRSPEKLTLTNQPIFIASSVSKQTSCGLHGSPWIIEALQGQNIIVIHVDFGWQNGTTGCPKNYGYILDMESDDVINICGGGNREKYLYQSSGHSIQIVLERSMLENNDFLLEFEAVGCPEYKPPEYTWIQKENESIVTGCLVSDTSWKLTCVDNQWLGLVGNCTKPPDPVQPVIEDAVEPDKDHASSKSAIQPPYISNNHVIIFTMGCLTLVLCCLVVIIGVFCKKRFEVKIKKYRARMTSGYGDGNLTLASNTFMATYKPVNGSVQMDIGRQPDTQNTIRPPAYTFPKSRICTQGPQVPARNMVGNESHNNLNHTNVDSAYENISTQAEDVESVQYYILENPDEFSGTNNVSRSDKNNQNIHLQHNLI